MKGMAEEHPEPLSEYEKAFLADENLVAALDRANEEIRNGQTVRRTRQRTEQED
jgi:hypothetical protein